MVERCWKGQQVAWRQRTCHPQIMPAWLGSLQFPHLVFHCNLFLLLISAQNLPYVRGPILLLLEKDMAKVVGPRSVVKVVTTIGTFQVHFLLLVSSANFVEYSWGQPVDKTWQNIGATALQILRLNRASSRDGFLGLEEFLFCSLNACFCHRQIAACKAIFHVLCMKDPPLLESDVVVGKTEASYDQVVVWPRHPEIWDGHASANWNHSGISQFTMTVA